MIRESVLLLVVGVSCLAVYGIIAGAGGVATTTSGTYDVTFPTDDLFTYPSGDPTADPTADQSGAASPVERRLAGAVSGQGGWIGPIGIVVVFGLWLLVAFRIMGAPSLVFVLMLLGVLAAIVFLIGPGGTRTAGASADQSIGILEQLILLVVALTMLTASIALFLPDNADAYTTDWQPFQFVAGLLSGLVGSARTRVARRDVPTPDTEIYRLWFEFATRFGDDHEAVHTRTPGELARRARQAGAPDDAVTDLRRIFEQARYGDASVTAEQVDRATTAWNRITQELRSEETHARDDRNS